MCQACVKKEVNWDDPEDIVIKLFESLRATSILVGILKHHGKINVPKNVFMEILKEDQIFPNDFITKNGSMANVTYDKSSDEFGFELRYMDEYPHPDNTVGFQCTRSMTHVGDIDYDSPYYRQ
jgi:hypothetical protein